MGGGKGNNKAQAASNNSGKTSKLPPRGAPRDPNDAWRQEMPP